MELSVVAVLGLVAIGLVWLIVLGLLAGRRAQAQAEALGRRVEELLAQGHRGMLSDLHAGLDRQGDRITTAQTDSAERLRALVGEELRATREAMARLQLNLTQQQEALKTAMIGQTMEKLGEVSRADRELLQDGLRQASMQLGSNVELLTRTLNERLDAISGVVHQRLDEGFRKTNETFASVMARLATIDEAQKKIGDLTTNVVSLQELLGDKRSRGAFGEVQLEALVRNVLPPDAFSFQHTLSNAARADCVLRLPEPTGMVAVDAKFPLENYHRMFDEALAESDRKSAQTAFKADVKRHVDAIANKYIVAGETSDGAVMFLPAEAVFAEVHAYHPDLVSYAQARRVWIVSPTTLMAVLNTARAVLKDVETRKQIHLIKDALGKLSKDFSRFDERMAALARHIDQANKDVQEVHVSSRKISGHFMRIESVQLEDVPQALATPDDPAQ